MLWNERRWRSGLPARIGRDKKVKTALGVVGDGGPV